MFHYKDKGVFTVGNYRRNRSIKERLLSRENIKEIKISLGFLIRLDEINHVSSTKLKLAREILIRIDVTFRQSNRCDTEYTQAHASN